MTRTVQVVRRGRAGRDGSSNLLGVQTLGSSKAVSSDESGTVFRATSALTLNFPSTVPNGFMCQVVATNGTVTLRGNGIGPSDTRTITSGGAGQVYSDGTDYFLILFSSGN